MNTETAVKIIEEFIDSDPAGAEEAREALRFLSEPVNKAMMQVDTIVTVDGLTYVVFKWGGQSAKLTPDEARSFALHILERVGQANTDAFLSTHNQAPLVRELRAQRLERN